MSHATAAVVRADRDVEFDLTVWLLVMRLDDDDVDDINWIRNKKKHTRNVNNN